MSSERSSTTASVTEHVIFELHPKEIELLRLIREKIRYGEITIKTRDGLPFRVVETVQVHDLELTK